MPSLLIPAPQQSWECGLLRSHMAAASWFVAGQLVSFGSVKGIFEWVPLITISLDQGH